MGARSRAATVASEKPLPLRLVTFVDGALPRGESRRLPFHHCGEMPAPTVFPTTARATDRRARWRSQSMRQRNCHCCYRVAGIWTSRSTTSIILQMHRKCPLWPLVSVQNIQLDATSGATA